MKYGIIIGLLVLLCLGVYWPQTRAEFVLDDYYTIVRNPLIKNPSLYQNIWTSRLFDAHQSSRYIKFGYYRPILQSSWILDYSLFRLKAFGYQWTNLLIHGFNCFLIYILLFKIFGQSSLALKASLLFCVLPSQEWAVRYVTGRGDELSALFALIALLMFLKSLSNSKKYLVLAVVFLVLASLTREIAISYVLYAGLITYVYFGNKDVNRFSLLWVLIGVLPILVIGSIIPKQGNILVLHIFYLASVGFCLWMAQLRVRWFFIVVSLFAAVSFYQGRFWESEEVLLRHTQGLQWWPRTVVDQQLLMKYDEDQPAIKDMIDKAQDPLIKAMWLRRLGAIYFNHGDMPESQDYFAKALTASPSDLDTINALAVVYLREGKERQGIDLLNHSLEINASYPDTLRTFGLYFYLHKAVPQARIFLNRCLIFDPDNTQAQELLRLANKAI